MTEGGGLSNWTLCLRSLWEQLIPICTKQLKSGVCPITEVWLKAALLTIKHTPVKNCVLMRSIVWCAPWLAQKSSLKICDQELLIYIKPGKVTKPSLKVWMFINPQLEKLSTNGKFGTVASLPRSGRPPKITRVQRRILREVFPNPNPKEP